MWENHKEERRDRIELLTMRGLKDKPKVKLVRHHDSKHRGVVQEMYATGEMGIHQAYQGKPILKNMDWVVSFLGLEGSLSLLVGVYRNRDVVRLPRCLYLTDANTQRCIVEQVQRGVSITSWRRRLNLTPATKFCLSYPKGAGASDPCPAHGRREP